MKTGEGPVEPLHVYGVVNAVFIENDAVDHGQYHIRCGCGIEEICL